MIVDGVGACVIEVGLNDDMARRNVVGKESEE